MSSMEKKKVVFIMGATGTGKSRLSVDLAAHFPAEIINSDKMQVYSGLDVVTNKMTDAERRGVVHHLLGVVDDPDSDFTAEDFRHHAVRAVEKIARSGRVPVVAGGSNSFVEALVEEEPYFKYNYECCFIWVDVSLPVLHSFVSKRVDHMVDRGLVEEVRSVYVPGADYTRGVRRAIGVPEMDGYLSVEKKLKDNTSKERLLQSAIEEIKANTCKLISTQLRKIHRLRNERGWQLHRFDATPALERSGGEAEEAWEELVVGPSLEVVFKFLKENKEFVGGGAAASSEDHSLGVAPMNQVNFEGLQVLN